MKKGIPKKIYGRQSYQNTKGREDESNASRTIIRDILETNKVDFLTTNDFGNTLTDNIVSEASLDIELVADIVVQNLYQTIMHGDEPYVPNFNAIFSGVGHAQNAFHPSRQKSIDNIAYVHEEVKKRMDNPSTPMENYLAENCREEMAFWVSEFDAPDLDELPMPSRALIDSIDALGQTCQAFGQAVDRHLYKDQHGLYGRDELEDFGDSLHHQMLREEAAKVQGNVSKAIERDQKYIQREFGPAQSPKPK